MSLVSLIFISVQKEMGEKNLIKLFRHIIKNAEIAKKICESDDNENNKTIVREYEEVLKEIKDYNGSDISEIKEYGKNDKVNKNQSFLILSIGVMILLTILMFKSG
ncbi:MAG: hypothetical protein I3274_02830 [Candidatus Moeniiplasma glomeromycotorum]|nr:hypothetical protein [Candidatus Moeniiplasma glomeromycotorum]MCE8167540.1 hypothetical protein [Candidatus Moeniiplasma glomeromycotorum]